MGNQFKGEKKQCKIADIWNTAKLMSILVHRLVQIAAWVHDYRHVCSRPDLYSNTPARDLPGQEADLAPWEFL